MPLKDVVDKAKKTVAPRAGQCIRKMRGGIVLPKVIADKVRRSWSHVVERFSG